MTDAIGQSSHRENDSAPPSTPSARATTNCYSVRLSRFTSDAGKLSKTIALRSDGLIDKRSAVFLSSGTVESLAISFDDFARVLDELGTNQALSFGIPVRGTGPVMSEASWQACGCPPDVLLRNRQNFVWPNGPAILMIDYDPPKGRDALSRDEFLKTLYAAMPALETAAHYWRPSAGSCIVNAESGAEIYGVRGQRVYVLVDNGHLIPKIGEILAARLWLAGHGRIEVGSIGQLLERTLVDTMVWQPERLDFAAGAICEPPLEQRRPPAMRLGGSMPLDTAAEADLTQFEQKKLERLKRDGKLDRTAEARLVKEACVERDADALHKKCGIDRDTANQIIRYAYEQHWLMGDFVLTTTDEREVQIKEILAHPEEWHGERFRDPLDREYDDHRIAWVNLFSGGRPYLWSHAHGGARYILCRAATTIEIAAGGMAGATERTLAAMAESRIYFDRGNGVVVIGEDGAVVNLGSYALKQKLEQDIAYQKFNARQGKPVPIDCPDELANRILGMRGERGLPVLLGVTQFPTITPQGRLIDRPGYDTETKLLLINPTGVPWPRVPLHPTREHVLRALDHLWSPFSKFPFLDATSRGVVLAAILTAVSRRALGPSPAFMIGAPIMGSGKTLLARALLALTGPHALSTLSDREEEVQKVLISKLRTAPAALFFDNVTGVVDSQALNAMLTSDVFEGRILGQSEVSGALSTNVLVIMTGNNARPAADMCRRMLVATIDPRSDEPFLRQFDFSPVEMIQSQRMQYVVSALTILRGWLASGDPRLGRGALASFEEWDHLVRQAVIWVARLEQESVGSDRAIGFGDPIADVQKQFSQDEETEMLSSVLESWHKAGERQGYKAADLFHALDDVRRGFTVKNAVPPMLASALYEAHPKVQTPKGLATWLKRYRNRVVGVLRLEGVQNAAEHITYWRVASL